MSKPVILEPGSDAWWFVYETISGAVEDIDAHFDSDNPPPMLSARLDAGRKLIEEMTATLCSMAESSLEKQTVVHLAYGLGASKGWRPACRVGQEPPASTKLTAVEAEVTCKRCHKVM